MSNLTSQFTLCALIDGTTINAVLASTKPLEQWYNSADKSVTPNYEDEVKGAELQPVIYLVVRDTTTGNPIPAANIKNLKWFYNQVEIDFSGPVTLNKNPEFPGLFEDVRHNAFGSTMVPALRVRKNFPQFGSYNNDTITVQGSVEYDGQQVWFKDIEIQVVIQEKQRDIFSIHIDDTYGFQIPKGQNETTSTAKLLRAGYDVDNSGYQDVKFVWEIAGVDGYTAVDPAKISGANDRTIKIHKDDIEHKLVIRCTAMKGDEILARTMETYTDYNDPMVIETLITLKGGGELGEYVRRGQTAVVTPRVVTREGHKIFQGKVDYRYRLIKNNGVLFGDIKTGPSLEVSYDQLIEGGVKIKGNIEAKF